jgi:alcohol dehydrogenase class IV
VSTQPNELRKFVVPEFIFGNRARCLSGRYVHNYGAFKVLVVSDPGVIAAGWTQDVLQSLADLGVPYALYPNVSPNPRVEQVMAGAQLFREQECNVILAVGGGSPMDCAKGIGIIASNGHHILDYVGVDQVPVPIPPLICVPTTGGTGADVSQFCILSDKARRRKVALLSKTLVPDVSLIDPETLVTMPPDLTAHTAFDALTHAIEAYVSNASSAVTDLFALEAIRLITTYLLPSMADPSNVELRKQLMLASLNAGMAFSNASLGIVHAMAHPLDALLDQAHGLSNSMVLGVGIAYNFAAVPERFQAIAHAMGIPMRGDEPRYALAAILGEIDRLRRSAGIMQTLKQAGVTPEDIPQLVEHVMRDPCLATNPRLPTGQEVEALYAQAL